MITPDEWHFACSDVYPQRGEISPGWFSDGTFTARVSGRLEVPWGFDCTRAVAQESLGRGLKSDGVPVRGLVVSDRPMVGYIFQAPPPDETVYGIAIRFAHLIRRAGKVELLPDYGSSPGCLRLSAQGKVFALIMPMVRL